MIPEMGGGGGYPDSGPKHTPRNPEPTSLAGIYSDKESTRDQAVDLHPLPNPRRNINNRLQREDKASSENWPLTTSH